MKHAKFYGKKDRKSQTDRFEFGLHAPADEPHKSQKLRRHIRAVLNRDTQRNDMDLEFDLPENDYEQDQNEDYEDERAPSYRKPSGRSSSYESSSSSGSTPRARFFLKNLSGRSEQNLYGVEAGFDVETSPKRHWNTSVTVIYKYAGGGYGGGYGGRGGSGSGIHRDDRVGDIVQGGEFNYTVIGAVQTPVAWVNVSATTAKHGSTLMMEYNLTYFM